MMNQVLQTLDLDIEEGEITDSSEDGYTPLVRPNTKSNKSPTNTTIMDNKRIENCDKMEHTLEVDNEDSQSDSDSASSSGEDSDGCLKKITAENCHKKKKLKRTVMVRVPPMEGDKRGVRFKKYNIWTEALQEALTENLRGCDVTQNSSNDRNVENYDFSLHHRLNGKNSLKRRLSNSGDDGSDREMLPAIKRGKISPSHANKKQRRKSSQHHSRGSSSSLDNFEPLYIPDLNDISNKTLTEIGKEIADKLQESKNELFVRIVEVLGSDIPVDIFRETQRIEADGGMLIMNGSRRRTPGGVFLFLLKRNDHIKPEEIKLIFLEEKQNDNKWNKKIKSKSRDRKVEELKKRLSQQEKELSALSTRKDILLLGSELNVENQSGNLSNPPPSPVGQDQSPEYKSHNHAINHAGNEKPSTSSKQEKLEVSTNHPTLTAINASKLNEKELLCYDDDFLDVNCGDMDLF